MTIRFPIQPIQPIPDIFSSPLASEIFDGAKTSGCPFFAETLIPDNELLSNNPQADVVITGQQPGFMGGPLYTLYKIATTVSLARLRSESGHPTVPVFWAGDDDDDLVEALSPVAWDPFLGKLFSGKTLQAKTGSRVLSAIPSPEISLYPKQWLTSLSHRHKDPEAVKNLALVYSRAMDEGWSFSQLFCEGIKLIFKGTDLVIVKGNDAHLHEVSQPFYDQVLPKLPLLQKLARQDPGTAINERSISHPIFRLENGRRVRLHEIPKMWESSLRPGVLLRSLLQDWLFKPAAVVVGPGEQAYLNQLVPLYREMAIRRSPLVPRLFAWLAPVGIPADTIGEIGKQFKPTAEDHRRWVKIIQETIAAKMSEIHHLDAGIEKDLAREFSEKKAQRMTRFLPDYFKGADLRAQQFSQEGLPSWVVPQGHRQERKLAAFNAFALWGAPLVETILCAANNHLTLGRENHWQEMLITVPPPEDILRKDDFDE